jgi:hypothetical protein
MGPRTRKAIGSIVVVAFLIFYIWLAGSVSVFVPDHPAAELAFYAFAGTLWGVPLLPLFTWMQKKG